MKGFRRRWCGVLMACLAGLGGVGYVAPTVAQARVLAVVGHSASLSRYVPILNTDSLNALKAQQAALSQSANGVSSMAAMIQRAQRSDLPTFPVITPELTPGPVNAQTVNLPQIKRPVFIVGFDDFSRQWLKRYRERLAAIQAVGMVVNVENPSQFAQLQQEATVSGFALDLAPVSGSSVVKTLPISHYPVLISTNRLEQ